MVELRLELGNSLASLDKRTELIAQDLMALRREMNERFDRLNERFDQLSQQITNSRDETRRENSDLRQDSREQRQQMQVFRTNTQRQLWVIVLVVVAAIVTGVVKLVFFPTS
ncbi:hypothetical protein [Candidatus Entotheonella palauensis]|uniref:hypothetical protein n=1 Tax=Candidatus Entotheonella palauensis TaxID=93172 RepID=UPI000B7E90CF|nr:hypothetical protein [Candidatus Entotheonella palauensis]